MLLWCYMVYEKWWNFIFLNVYTVFFSYIYNTRIYLFSCEVSVRVFLWLTHTKKAILFKIVIHMCKHNKIVETPNYTSLPKWTAATTTAYTKTEFFVIFYHLIVFGIVFNTCIRLAAIYWSVYVWKKCFFLLNNFTLQKLQFSYIAAPPWI